MQQEQFPTIQTDYQNRTPKCGGTGKMVLIAPLYLCMIAGTGGVYTPANIPLRFTASQNQLFEVRGLPTKRNQLASISQHVISIRKVLGLKMSELALIFGVTRPAAYAWINGVEPKPELRAKILNLSRLVEELRSTGMGSVELLARQPIATDKSLIDLLKSGNDVSDAIISMKRSTMQNTHRTGLRREFGPQSRRRKVSADAISVPIVAELGEQS